MNKDLGKGPENEFSLISNHSKRYSPLMSDGSVDVKLLEWRKIWVSFVKLANKLENLPLKLFFPRDTILSSVRCPMEAGTSPTR